VRTGRCPVRFGKDSIRRKPMVCVRDCCVSKGLGHDEHANREGGSGWRFDAAGS